MGDGCRHLVSMNDSLKLWAKRLKFWSFSTFQNSLRKLHISLKIPEIACLYYFYAKDGTVVEWWWCVSRYHYFHDDYGSDVTFAIDDNVPKMQKCCCQKELQYRRSRTGSVKSLYGEGGRLVYNLDTFYLDPSTTEQNEFNSSQLLLSVSNLRKP